MAAHGGRGMSCAQVAKELGISVAGVSLAERRALRKLRANAQARKLFESSLYREHEEAIEHSGSVVSLRFAKSKKRSS